MADEEHPMKGGDGLHSYANNSSFQRGASEAAKETMMGAIAQHLVHTNTIKVADLGCSIGPNTFFAVQTIIDAIKTHNYQNTPPPHEFQVFFSDHTSNDFNTLFTSLPPNRPYLAAGVPGSFYGRLFPKASLHLVYSSFALHWLSRVPRAVLDKNSPAWNKGRIHYSNASQHVVEAYSAQYAKDMECFLQARAQEVVSGGLMLLIFPGRRNGSPHSESPLNQALELFGFCLMEMAKEGKISEEKVDSFNKPTYHACREEFEGIVERNGSFSIEKIQETEEGSRTQSASAKERAEFAASHLRAANEGLVKEHFGGDFDFDHLFHLFTLKLQQFSILHNSNSPLTLSFLLKRN